VPFDPNPLSTVVSICTSHFKMKALILPTECVYVKGKGLPQQAWTGSRGSRQVKVPDFLDV